MEHAPSPLADPKLWISVLALLASGWSAFNSWRSRRLAARALFISESQEQRRQPQLGIYMADGYSLYLPDKQLFGFLVSISNPTDVNNSVAQAELQFTYVLDNDIKAVCRIPHTPTLAEATADTAVAKANIFSLPARIDAHQPVAGWLVFALDISVIENRTIDSYRIILEDSHGICSETEPILIRDWMSEDSKD